MFRSLCLTAKINCTYKTQITFFNLKMIGPGPSPRAWSVCDVWLYFTAVLQIPQYSAAAQYPPPPTHMQQLSQRTFNVS